MLDKTCILILNFYLRRIVVLLLKTLSNSNDDAGEPLTVAHERGRPRDATYLLITKLLGYKMAVRDND